MTKIEKLRRKKGMTQFQLAIRTGIEQCRISNFEKMRNNIDNARIETVCKFAKTLNVKAWEILNDQTLCEMLYSVSEYDEIEHDEFFDGTRFAEIRTLRSMTQTELSQQINISQSKISQMERAGVDTVHIGTICGLCIHLSCNPCDLIDNKTLREELRGIL